MKLKTLLLAITVGFVTAFGQDTVKISYEQETLCLECLERQSIKDSVITHQSDLINLKDSLLIDCRKVRYTLENDVREAQAEADRQKKAKNKVTVFSGVMLVVLGIFVSL